MPRKTADEVARKTSKEAAKRSTRKAPPLFISSPLAAPRLLLYSPLAAQQSSRALAQSKRPEKLSYNPASKIHHLRTPLRLLDLPREIFWKILAYVLDTGIVRIHWHRVSDRNPSRANKKPLANIVPVQKPCLPSILLACKSLRSQCYDVFCTETTFNLGSPVGFGHWNFALRLRKLYQSVEVQQRHRTHPFIMVRVSGALHQLVGTKDQPGPLAFWTTEHFPALQALTLNFFIGRVRGAVLEQLVMCVRLAAMGISEPKVEGFYGREAVARIENAMRCGRPGRE